MIVIRTIEVKRRPEGRTRHLHHHIWPQGGTLRWPDDGKKAPVLQAGCGDPAKCVDGGEFRIDPQGREKNAIRLDTARMRINTSTVANDNDVVELRLAA